MVCACTGAIWQVRSTVPLKPLPVVPTVMSADDVPPGSTATSDSEGACSVKFCADVGAGKIRKTATRHKDGIPARPARTICLDLVGFDLDDLGFDDSDGNGSALNHSDCGDRDFNMSRFRFK